MSEKKCYICEKNTFKNFKCNRCLANICKDCVGSFSGHHFIIHYYCIFCLLNFKDKLKIK